MDRRRAGEDQLERCLASVDVPQAVHRWDLADAEVVEQHGGHPGDVAVLGDDLLGARLAEALDSCDLTEQLTDLTDEAGDQVLEIAG